ncbi:hypothetical protein SAMN04515674_101471 [Pseudarcicella hirudinis]|uniref:LysM domain-containing protein n=1 Tax=Pseudarcicella hirudinis TaxID=1079859 RepID=A0A1I5MVV1_9BACT|nr:hypothetical protein [Pseudarcicella hirudinis]SFP13652.1 hypothetical protein SAMN04515674_101471 [Pseudarcicella hirudinis]
MKYQVKQKQTLYDVALQFYGDIAGVQWLIEDNALTSLTDPITNLSLEIRDDKIKPQTVRALSPYSPIVT